MADDKNVDIDRELKELELEQRRQALQMTKQQVQQFNEEQENRERVTRIRSIAVEKEQEERERRQRACRHKTGGKGKQGFLQGDGAKGYCVGTLVLPMGEVYYLCSRCQKEWHHPNWIRKIEVLNTGKSKMTKSQFDKMLKEYEEAANWDHPYTEAAEASQFEVPLLKRIDPNKIPFAAEVA